MMPLGGKAFGRFLRHKGGVLMNGISALIKETPPSYPPPPPELPSPLSPCEDTEVHSLQLEAGPHQNLTVLEL